MATNIRRLDYMKEADRVRSDCEMMINALNVDENIYVIIKYAGINYDLSLSGMEEDMIKELRAATTEYLKKRMEMATRIIEEHKKHIK